MNRTLLVMAAILLLPAVAGSAASVKRTADRIEIRLDNGITMEGVLSGKQFKGIGRVRLQDVVLKSADVLQRPQVEVAGRRPYEGGDLAWGQDPLAVPAGEKIKEVGGAGDYSKCELVSARAEGANVIIVTKITDDKTGLADELAWEIAPHEATIKGVRFVGLGYTYRFKSDTTPLFAIQDTFSWGLGGTIENAWILESGHAQSYQVKKKLTTAGDLIVRQCRDPAYEEYPKLYNLSNTTPLTNYTHFDFRFQYGDHGLLFAHNKYPVYGVRRIMKPAGNPQITYQHRYRFSRERIAETPEMIVLFAPELKSPTPLGVEDWHGIVYDYVHRKRCEFYGVEPTPKLTVAAKAYMNLHWFNGIQANQSYLDTLAEWGFQAIWWKGWEDNHDNRLLGSIDYTHNLRPGVRFGGEDAVKEFCDYAHKLGIKVICWCPTFYIGGRSLHAAQHPEWLMRTADGQYHQKRFYSSAGHVKSYGTYTELVVFDLNSGYREHFLKSYRHLRELGIDGVWMDSYPNNTIDCVHHRAPDWPVYDISGIFSMTAELMKMGFWVGYEGSGPLGIPCAGSVQPIIDDRLFGYQRIYGWQKLFWARRYLTEDQVKDNFYYKSCANKSPCGIVAGSDANAPIHKDCPRKLADWIIQANKDWQQVWRYMQYRHLIPNDRDPEEEKAVEWTNDGEQTRVLWSYEPFDYTVPTGFSVRDVTADKPVAIRNGKLRTEAWHTYLLRRQTADDGRRKPEG